MGWSFLGAGLLHNQRVQARQRDERDGDTEQTAGALDEVGWHTAQAVFVVAERLLVNRELCGKPGALAPLLFQRGEQRTQYLIAGMPRLDRWLSHPSASSASYPAERVILVQCKVLLRRCQVVYPKVATIRQQSRHYCERTSVLSALTKVSTDGTMESEDESWL
jgi:hypothetical protein